MMPNLSKKLGEICNINPAYKINVGDICTFIEMSSVSESSPKIKKFEKRVFAKQSGSKFRNGDVLFARITPCTENGKTALVEEMATEYGFGSTEFIVLSPKKEFLDSTYLYYLVKSDSIRKLAISQMTGSTGRQRVPNTFFKEELEVFLPDIAEQRKITAILKSVDDAIEKTVEIIKQTQKVKSALMQQLLSKGIGHKEFKHTDIGEIPIRWELTTLGAVTLESAFGPRFPAGEYSDNGNYALLRTTDISSDWEINYESMPLAKLPEDKFDSHRLRDQDLLITRSGTCGVVSIFKDCNFPVIPGAFLIRFRLNDKVSPSFVRYLMMDSKGQARIQQMVAGGVQKNLSGTNLKTLVLPLPGLDEQLKIVEIIDSIQRKIEVEKKKVSQLLEVKESLMQSLLSGNVRVEDDAITEVLV